MNSKLIRNLTTLALLIAGHGVANAGVLSTSAVWAGDKQIIHCSATNQANEPRPVTIEFVDQNGTVVQSFDFVPSSGAVAHTSMLGLNQFTTCRFDSHAFPKASLRANIHLQDPKISGPLFLIEAH